MIKQKAAEGAHAAAEKAPGVRPSGDDDAAGAGRVTDVRAPDERPPSGTRE